MLTTARHILCLVAAAGFALAACMAPAAQAYTCSAPCSSSEALPACSDALTAEQEAWYIDTADTTVARVNGDWVRVNDTDSHSVTSSSPYLNGYFLSDVDEDKGHKRITFTMRVPFAGAYTVTLLHPASLVAATSVPVDITLFEDGSIADGADKTIDQRKQTRPEVGGSLLGTFNVSSLIIVTVSTTNTHIDTDNLFGNNVLVDGLLLEPQHINLCKQAAPSAPSPPSTSAQPQQQQPGSSSSNNYNSASTTGSSNSSPTTSDPGLGAGGSTAFFQSQEFVILASVAGAVVVIGVIMAICICRCMQRRNVIKAEEELKEFEKTMPEKLKVQDSMA